MISKACTGPNIAAQGRDGGQWPGFFWGLIIGFQLSVSSYAFGKHAALFIHHHLVHDPSSNVDPRTEELTEDIESQDAGQQRCLTVLACSLTEESWLR